MLILSNKYTCLSLTGSHLALVHFSGSHQNAYLGEELKGFCIIKIQFLFSFRGLCPSDPLTRGSAPGPRWGLRTPTPHHSKEIAATAQQLTNCTASPQQIELMEFEHKL